MEFELNEIDLDKVLRFAEKKHKGQFRKDGVTPYIEHPKKVAELIKQYKNNSSNLDKLIACALLHDVIEDTYTSYKELIDEFGIVVASMVMEVTTAGYVPILMGKDKYLAIKMLNMTSYALDIKLADRLANIMDLNFNDTEKINKYLYQTRSIIDAVKEKEKLTKTQIKLIDEIEKVLKSYNV